MFLRQSFIVEKPKPRGLQTWTKKKRKNCIVSSPTIKIIGTRAKERQQVGEKSINAQQAHDHQPVQQQQQQK